MNKRLIQRAFVLAAAGGALLGAVPGASEATGSKSFVCNMKRSSNRGLSGKYYSVVVPANGFCLLDGATVTQDVTAYQNSTLAIQSTVIGHDLIAYGPQALSTGAFAGPGSGRVFVGHDLGIYGSDGANGVAYDICYTRVSDNLRITGTVTHDEIDLGDTGSESFCAAAARPWNSIGGSVNITSNQPARLDIGNNTIGGNLTVAQNTATNADGGGASVDVSDNRVGRNATCSQNQPAATLGGDGDGDGSNTVTGTDSGCL